MRLSLLLFAFLISACASVRAPVQSSSGDLGQDSLAATKTKAKLQVQSRTFGQSGLPYFAELQILSESVEQSGCSDKDRRVEEFIEDYIGTLNSEKTLLVRSSSEPVSSLFNVKMRTIGFDESRYEMSVLNGESLQPLPYSIELNVRPGNSVNFRFLNESVEMNLESRPVHSFQAIEKRGSCEIVHNVNLFAEVAGRFEAP